MKSTTRLTFEEFINNATGHFTCLAYAKSCYKKYLALTDSQLAKIELLKSYQGRKVLYQRGKKKIEMILMCIGDGERKIIEGLEYQSTPFCIRLNYHDYLTNTKREWRGFWTINVDKIELIN